MQQQKIRAGVTSTENYCYLGCLWRMDWLPVPAWLPSCYAAMESKHDALALSPDLSCMALSVVRGTGTLSNNGLTFRLVYEHHSCTPRPRLLQRHTRRKVWNTQNVTLFCCNYLLVCALGAHDMACVWRSEGNLWGEFGLSGLAASVSACRVVLPAHFQTILSKVGLLFLQPVMCRKGSLGKVSAGQVRGPEFKSPRNR